MSPTRADLVKSISVRQRYAIGFAAGGFSHAPLILRDLRRVPLAEPDQLGISRCLFSEASGVVVQRAGELSALLGLPPRGIVDFETDRLAQRNGPLGHHSLQVGAIGQRVRGTAALDGGAGFEKRLL